MSGAVRNVVVAGGGLYGWSAAAALANSLAGTGVAITVADLDDTPRQPTVEHVLPPTLDFFRHLGIDMATLVRDAGATFRLGTRRRDWPAPGDDGLCAFGRYGADVGFIPFHHHFVRAGEDAERLDAYSVGATAAAQGRFALPPPESRSLLSRLAFGLMLEREPTARIVEARAVRLGVRTVRGTLAEVVLNGERGFIDALRLADGTRLSGELFIDCTGSDARLIGAALESGYADWSAYLPCNRLREEAVDRAGPTPPLLDCRATDGGWVIRQPLQRRDVVSFLHPAAAGEPDSTDAPYRWVNGHRRHFWRANCVALGGAAGMLEPLVFSPLHLVQSGVTRLLRMLPDTACDARLAEEYNRATTLEYENARDYLLVHYAASRRDGPPWTATRAAAKPDSFERRRALFASTGRVLLFDEETFDRDAWSTAWLKAGVRPQSYDPLLERMPAAELDGHYARLEAAIAKAVASLPAHDDFIDGLRATPRTAAAQRLPGSPPSG